MKFMNLKDFIDFYLHIHNHVNQADSDFHFRCVFQTVNRDWCNLDYNSYTVNYTTSKNSGSKKDTKKKQINCGYEHNFKKSWITISRNPTRKLCTTDKSHVQGYSDIR